MDNNIFPQYGKLQLMDKGVGSCRWQEKWESEAWLGFFGMGAIEKAPWAIYTANIEQTHFLLE